MLCSFGVLALLLQTDWTDRTWRAINAYSCLGTQTQPSMEPVGCVPFNVGLFVYIGLYYVVLVLSKFHACRLSFFRRTRRLITDSGRGPTLLTVQRHASACCGRFVHCNAYLRLILLLISWPTFMVLYLQLCVDWNKKASIRWQDSAPPISGYWPTSEPNAG